MPDRQTYARINLAHLKHNYQLAKRLNQGPCYAAIKANAYGHGIEQVGLSMDSYADGLAVAFVDEALTLRNAGVKSPILVLQGPHDAEQVKLAIRYQLDLVIERQQQLTWLGEHKGRSDIVLWLKVDTGMHRLGFSVKQASQALTQLQVWGFPHIRVMTHFSNADDPDNCKLDEQMRQFNQVSLVSEEKISVANSAAILKQVVAGHIGRPGIMLYGVSPFEFCVPLAQQLKPVMTLETQIQSLRWIMPGESVGYGAGWTATRKTLVATLMAGYGDGYPRLCSTQGHSASVMINGQAAPLIGRVSMDMMGVDVTDISDIALGNKVQLWGESMPVNTVAAHANTIGYELLAALPARVPRYYQN